MKDNIRAVVTLTVITVIAGLMLGYVYELTKDPIAIQKEASKQASYRSVFPDASGFAPYEGYNEQEMRALLDQAGFSGETVSEVLTANDQSGNILGYVLNVITMEGYGGEIDISMGVTSEGKLNGVEILTISETAGLGMKADTDEFKSQFKDKTISQFAYTKSGATKDYEIDALSGATITTNAFVNAVNAGLIYCQNISGGNADE
ncbi:MAG: RnfABCDGE type electron transport complex subunit G [Lachnospiraceae bacterium]|nr:RnfABCDGE type electron transport complex subunit G [Lachnospiraceae bacterium]